MEAIVHVVTNLSSYNDPRMDGRFLMGSLWQPILLLACYYFFVRYLGPKLMENRPAFKLRTLLIVYNSLQILLNAGIFYMVTDLSVTMKMTCTPVDKSDAPIAERHAFVHYCYILSKVFDFLDTVFFVLRKKYNQASFLHVYHHSGIFAASWVAGKYFAGGHGLYVGWANSFLHTLMYLYYLLTSFETMQQKTVWWKKYITQLQIIQLCYICVALALSLLNSECSYPKPLVLVFFLNMLNLIYLFVRFYIATYIKKNK